MKLNKELTTNGVVRVFESFSGVGTQVMGLHRLKDFSREHGLEFEFESTGISDWNIPSIISYGAIHGDHELPAHKDLKKYLDTLDKEDLISLLLPQRLSFNDKTEATEDNYRRRKVEDLRDLVYYSVVSKNKGNIQLLKGKDIKDLDLFTYSFPCFTGDTLVLTDKGYKELKNVEVGDQVLTHTNEYKPVIKTFDNGVQDIYRINATAFHELKATYNHKFYVRDKKRVWDNSRRSYNRVFGEPQWLELKDLTKDYYLGVAINTKEIIPDYRGYTRTIEDGRVYTYNRLVPHMNNKDFWYIIGRYIGDGWVRTQGGIIISENSSKIKEVTDVLERLEFNYNLDIEGPATKIHIPFQEIGEFVQEFGHGAKNKRLTNTILDLPKGLLQSFIEGYLGADGYITDKGYHRITSVSKELIYGVAQAVAKVYNTPYAIYPIKNKPTKIIEGRTINQRDAYELRYRLDTRIQDQAFYENGYIWFPINSIEHIGEDSVYDIEVEEDHSFTANSCIVHNCQDISVAGKGAGFKDTSTRSGLVWEVVRALSEQDFSERPKVLLMENVKALTFKNYEEGWVELQEIIEDLGYTNYYDILTATDYGVAQSRERVFMVSVRNDIDFKYEFPEPLELTNTLEDYLEPKVDSKYYISEQMLNGMRVTKFNQYSLRKNLKSRGEIANTIVTRFEGAPQVVIDSNDNEEDKRTLKEKLVDNLLGSGVLKGGEIINHSYTNSKSRPTPKDYIESDNGIMPTLTTRPDTLGYVERQGAGIRTRINEDGEREPHMELRPNDSSNCLTTFAKDSVVVELETQVIDKIIGDGKDSLDYKEIEEMGLRVRKLTPREAWRLMGIEDKYFDKVKQLQSNSVLYKQAGNAIVVDVLYHIFRKLYLEGER